MIALLKYLIAVLDNIDLSLVGKEFLSFTLETPLYLTFTIKSGTVAMICVPICLTMFWTLIQCPKI